MLSVLIPTYNYDVSQLIATINSQLINSTIAFEIIVLEDGSSTNINTNNQLINTTIIVNKNNVGRVKARQALASHASYDWLLFLDADVLPKSEHFIANYIHAIVLKYDAYFGGFAYYKTKPPTEFILRWKYGKAKEQVLANKRNQRPYKVIISANYLIKKSVFNTVNSKITDTKSYGFDTYFGALLQEYAIKIWHLDNEVYHLGIEKSEAYLKKVDQATLTLLHFYNTEAIDSHSNDLLHFFLSVKKFRMLWLFSGFYRVFNKTMRQHLLGSHPSILILQFYKISFMCYAYKQGITA
ncbi:glycosyltransferase family 2 protein [Lacinutrix chionoecetis]